MFSKAVDCVICEDKVSVSSIRTDMEAGYPKFGKAYPDQQTITCPGCGKLVHTTCVEEAGTTISGHHLWFSNMMMRAFVREHGLIHLEVAFCKGCHGELSDQILANYKAMERFDEGARFLEDYGRVDEAFALLAEIKG